ncbi:MAG: beta-glucosidase [Phycisphaerae bacterium]|nr:beta-glucosidase [Phycisphaerae bacterium]
MANTTTPFPDRFVWGAASSAYQVEGAAHVDGRADSVWDAYCQVPGTIFENHTGETACDHYHRFKEDVEIMRRIGLRAYRFSISWPRVLPGGVGEVNEKGLAFYDRLVDALLESDIAPWLTLFHWDYPLALHTRGGWLNRESADWFADYTRIIVDRLSDRVAHWMTLNEPQCFIGGGPSNLPLAPGHRATLAEQLQMWHHAAIAHGRACQVIRERAKLKPSIGYAPVGVSPIPADNQPASIEAARRAATSVTHPNLWNNTWFNDPILLGRYPEDGLRVYGADAPRIQQGDMEIIQQKQDFLGLNIYHGLPTRMNHAGQPEEAPRPPGYPRTAFNWPVDPESLYWGPRFMHERYKTPIYITENGLSNTDSVSLDGKVHDPQRIDFLRRYLRELRRAIADGADIRGYFQWSIMDNFEWLDGYKQRFGLVHIDYTTQKRTPKDSAWWYAHIIESNGAALEDDPFQRSG